MTSSETIMGSFIYTKGYNMVNDTNNGIGGSAFLIAAIGCLINTSMCSLKQKGPKYKILYTLNMGLFCANTTEQFFLLKRDRINCQE